MAIDRRRWSNIQVEIRNPKTNNSVKGIKVSPPQKDIARQKQPLQNQHLTEEHVDIETRKEITSWLSSPTVNWTDLLTLDESNALTS